MTMTTVSAGSQNYDIESEVGWKKQQMFNELHDLSKNQKKRRDISTEEIEYKRSRQECTFKPTIIRK